jgi:PadR family transcriptional regulator PadR
MSIYLHISGSVRRKPGELVPLEQAICLRAADLLKEGVGEFHGYDMAKRLAQVSNHKLLTAYGTLYRALGRLEGMGLLESHKEDPHIPAREGRPGRRLYRLTSAGEAAAAAVRRTAKHPTPARRRLAPA